MKESIKIFDLTKQFKNLSKEINRDVINILRSGQYILGKNVHRLENAFTKFLNVKYAVSCNSGTDALILSLRASKIGKNDEVITTPFTYFATAEAIALVGAKPIFVDINPDTYNIDINQIEKHITKKTKAIMPVHIFGQSSDIDKIAIICKKHKIKLIEDCAQSFGAKKNDLYTGTFGDFGCYSFFPTKNLGCAGDGGMIVTNSKKNMIYLKKLRNHGGLTRNIHEYIGYNSRLDEIQAAILLTKLKKIKAFDKKRNIIAKKYKSSIINNKIKLPYQAEGTHHVYNQFTICVKNRKRFSKYLENNGIPYGVYYPIPIYKQKALKSFKYKCYLKNTEKITKECISLPMYPELSISAIDYIVEKINNYK